MLKKALLFSISYAITGLACSGTMSDFGGFGLDGAYIGVGAGLINVYNSDNLIARKSNSPASFSETERSSNTSVLFTGNIGYWKPYIDAVYVGAKANVFYTPFNNVENDSYTVPNGTTATFGNNTYTTQIRPFYNLDATIGYEVLPHIIPFVEGGLTFANVNKKYSLNRTVIDYLTNVSTQYNYTFSANNYSTGYNIGLGLNYQSQRHWVYTGELMYIDLGQNFGASGTLIPGTAVVDSQSRRSNSSAVVLFATISYLI